MSANLTTTDLQALLEENRRLKKVNAALIERIEAGSAYNAAPYAAFEHAATLAEQVRERTEALSAAMAELRQTNQALEEANLSRIKFLAAISHDLLQPLNAARLFTGALLERQLPSDLLHLSHSIHRSLQDVDSLLGTLVDISRLDAGVINPDISVFPVSDLLDNLAAEFRQICDMEPRQFHYQPSSVVVSTDLVLLARILRNFLTNAVRYTHPEASIVLGCRRRGAYLEIQVVDQGVGIAADQLSFIFEEFKKIHTQTGHQERGLGLGLAIVEKIAGMLAHPIRVTSVQGKGSLFSVCVPIANPSAKMMATKSHPVTDQALLQQSRIWVMDNDLSICTAMHSLLEGWGCDVKTFNNAKALDTALVSEQHKPDLFVVDYHLDEKESGKEAIQRLKITHQLSTPVLMITANHTSSLRQEVRQLGFKMLNKPVKPLKLKVTLAHLLRQQLTSDD